MKAGHLDFLGCGLINDYRSLSNYLQEFSDFIHWYEQMLSQLKHTAYLIVTETPITVWRDDFSGNFRFSLSDLQCIH